MVDTLICSRKHVINHVHVLDLDLDLDLTHGSKSSHNNTNIRDPEVLRQAVRLISNDSAKIFWSPSSNIHCSTLCRLISHVNVAGVSSSEVDRLEARLIGRVTMVARKHNFIQVRLGAKADENKRDIEREVLAKFESLFNRFNPSSTCHDKVGQPCAWILVLILPCDSLAGDATTSYGPAGPASAIQQQASGGAPNVVYVPRNVYVPVIKPVFVPRERK
jgi:hypothetical protein